MKYVLVVEAPEGFFAEDSVDNAAKFIQDATDHELDKYATKNRLVIRPLSAHMEA